MRVLLLGIDALDALLLEQFAGHLPNLSALRDAGANLKVKSTFPPDSDTAWATIVTGLNPAQHGVVQFVDPLEKSYQIQNVQRDNAVLRGKTLWEMPGQADGRAHAIFPHLCYPIWPTPGVMVVRGSSVAEVQANPPQILAEYPDPGAILGVRGLPDRGVEARAHYARRLADQALADAEFGLRLLQKLEWDFFFIYWSTLDAIAHYFWSYFDREDPGFVEGHPLQGVILDTYKLYDEIVGRYCDQVDDDVAIIVMSDHGHGTRPFKLVNVNEVLRQAGFLRARDLDAAPHLRMFEKGKRQAIGIVTDLGLARLAGRVMRRFPAAIQTFTRPSSINWQETLAYASDMSGIKSYSYGGIIINRLALGQRDYERVRDEIMELLEDACVLPDGSPLIRFIARREDLYSGPYIEKYPDIVLELKYGYGLGWAVSAPLLTRAAAHNLVPGSHRGDTGVFLISSSRPVARDAIDLRDVAPTVLDLMEVAGRQPFEGSSILAEEAR